MPIPLLAEGFFGDLSSIPLVWPALKAIPWIALIVLLKYYFGGAQCRSERVMHGKVIMITGGTAGVGSAVARELASRGAQIILLTRHAPTDPFLVDYIDDLRTSSNSELIYAEQVDLASLHSIRLFATKWVDNAPPRRLDSIILCANVMTPYFGTSRTTIDGLEEEWAVNYLANFHLLSILSPAIRAQPPDRDVRVLFSTCNSYIGGTLETQNTDVKTKSGSRSYARSKLALMTFAIAFQKHLDAYTRPDKQPINARVILVDPGFCRTPGTRRWLSTGTVWGLMVYLYMLPLWWLVLKSPAQGAQSYLTAIMEAEYARGAGGKMLKECREIDILQLEAKSEEASKVLWQFSEKQIEQLEKEGAVRRASAKKEKEKADSQKTEATSAGAEKKPTPGSRRSKKAR